MAKKIIKWKNNGIAIYLHHLFNPSCLVCSARILRLLSRSKFLSVAAGISVSLEFHVGDTFHLKNAETRKPDDFPRQAFLRMVQHSCDLVVVVTDVSLVSESKYIVPGLAAPEAQVTVISTKRLISVLVGEPVRDHKILQYFVTQQFYSCI